MLSLQFRDKYNHIELPHSKRIVRCIVAMRNYFERMVNLVIGHCLRLF